MSNFSKLLLIPLLVLGVLIGCQKRQEVSPEQPPVDVTEQGLTFVSVPVDVEAGLADGDDGKVTKSVFNPTGEISIDLAVNNIALFVFDASSKVIISDNGTPLYYVTDSQRFNMSLPLNHALDIFVLCNYGSDIPSSFFTNTLLNETLFISGLDFSCGSTESLRSLNSAGLPMAGVLEGVTITNDNPSITIIVQKLFSKYNLYLNTTPFVTEGYTISSSRVNIRQCNTVVPYFTPHYAQSNGALFADVDLAEAGDLTKLNSGEPITVYVLENCQGNKGNLSHWYDVAFSGLSGLDKCSYIDLGVCAEKNGKVSNFSYYIYLGDDCTKNFDIRRNELHNIHLTLRPSTAVSYGFAFTGAGDWNVLGSGSDYVDVPFETTISNIGDLVFSLSNGNLSSYNIRNFGAKSGPGETNFGYAGVVRLNAALNSTTFNQSVMVTGGNATANSMTDVTVNPFGLKWSGENVSVESGQTIQVPFETSFSNGDLVFSVGSSKLTVVSHTYGENEINTSDYPYGGYVTITAAPDAPSGDFPLTGGNGSVTVDIDIVVSGDKGFAFTSSAPLSVVAGETVTIPYETHLASSALSFSSSNPKLTYVSHSQGPNSTYNYEYAYSGTVTFAAASDAAAGSVTVTGGNANYNDTESIQINVVTYGYTRLVLSGDTSVQVGSSTSDYTATLYTQRYINGVADGEPTTSTVTSPAVTLTSSDNSVATISGMRANGIAAGSCVISASYTGTYGSISSAVGDRINLSVVSQVVTYEYTRLVINGDSSVDVGGNTSNYTGTLYTQEKHDGVAYGDPVTSNVVLTTVTSSNTSVATISGKRAYGVAAGSTRIGGTYTGTYGSITAAAGDRKTLTVNHVYTYSLVVTASDYNVEPGTSVTVQATFYTYEDGVQINSQNVTNSCTWTSDSGSYISGSGSSRNFISYSEGDYRAYATYNYMGTNYNDYASVTFEEQPYLYTSPSSLSWDWDQGGYSKTASVSTNMSGTITVSCTGNFTASYSNGTVTVYPDGNNTSGSDYEGLVSVKVNGATKATINLSQEHYAGPVVTYSYYLEVTPSSASISVGETQSFSARLYRQEQHDGEDYGSPTVVKSSGFSWDSDNNSVATVNSSGTATGVGPGSSTITASCTYQGTYYSDDASVTVIHEPVITYELQLSGASSALVGQNIQLTATFITYTDGVPTAQSDVTSSATYTRQSGSGNVSVSGSGSVSAVNPGGTATIRASYSGETADHSVTFNMNSGFEWITPDNQSVNEGNSITLEFWSSSNSVSIGSSSSKLTVGTPSYTSQSGTGNPWAYCGSVTVSAGDVDDDLTVTVTGSGGKTRTILIVAQWNTGFEWIDTDITVDAGSSTTARYRCSSATPTIDLIGSAVDIYVSPDTHQIVNGNYKYSGTATIRADSSIPNNTSATLRGMCGGVTDTTPCTVHNSAVITYQVVVTETSGSSGSHHVGRSMQARLAKYVNGVFDSNVDAQSMSDWSWETDDYSTFSVSGASVTGWYGTAYSVYYDTYSGTLSRRNSKITASVEYQGKTYSGDAYVEYRTTHHVTASLEKQSSTGNTRLRAVLNMSVPVSLIVRTTSGSLGYTLEFSTIAGTRYSDYDYSITQAQFNSLSVSTIYCSAGDPYYDEEDKAYFYF